MKNQLDLILSIVSIVLSIIGCIVLFAMRPQPQPAPAAPAVGTTTLAIPDSKGMVSWTNGLPGGNTAGGMAGGLGGGMGMGAGKRPGAVGSMNMGGRGPAGAGGGKGKMGALGF
jgi:hypothetical protein